MIKLYRGQAITYPSGKGIVMVSKPDLDGKIVVQDEQTGEYRFMYEHMIDTPSIFEGMLVEEVDLSIHNNEPLTDMTMPILICLGIVFTSVLALVGLSAIT